MASRIRSIKELLNENLTIPSYQRPYRWGAKNVYDLLEDISTAIKSSDKLDDFKYRIGTVILHDNGKAKDIVDGQQRLITLLLIAKYLESSLPPSSDSGISKSSLYSIEIENADTISNISNNYAAIENWFRVRDDDFERGVYAAFDTILEVVVIEVSSLPEAFQLFDSQNNRGRELDPHDLLKAYHLRAMRDYPHEMRHAVTEWEAYSASDIRDLYAYYLFPMQNWAQKEKSWNFSSKDIDIYKGFPQDSKYTYALRARQAMPFFQIGESFQEGESFFLMTEHYLQILEDVESELSDNPVFAEINKLLNDGNYSSTGFKYAKNLFFCATVYFYDRFHCFDEQAIRNLCGWAFGLRVDMEHLGFDSVNKYAIGGESNSRYSNSIPVFQIIHNAREHKVISNLIINLNSDLKDSETERGRLKVELEAILGGPEVERG